MQKAVKLKVTCVKAETELQADDVALALWRPLVTDIVFPK